MKFSLFDKMDLDSTLILDRHKDTLLSAGALKLRITDWFFFKKNIELKYIGLEDAIIKQNRTDSVWNYQFIVDYFSSPQKNKTKNKIVLKVQKLDLKNVVYTKKDDWFGQLMTLKTASLLVDADTIDLTKNLFLIHSIDMDRAYYKVDNYDGLDTVKRVMAKRDKTKPLFNPGNIKVHVANINLKNCFLGTGFRDEIPRAGFFDGRKIEISKITGTVKNLDFNKDTITAHVDVSAVERSGFRVRKLRTDYKLTPQKMVFSKLYIKTGESTITNYFEMQYDDFNADLKDYVNKVVMKSSIMRSLVSTDDIAYFAPALINWKERFLVNGNFYGTVSDFDVRNIFLKNGYNTYASGDLHVKDVTDVAKADFTLTNANLQTNSREISFIFPGITKVNSPNLAALGNVHFVGKVNFKTKNAVINANGNLASALGGMSTNLAMSFPKKSEPTYKGTVQTQQFNLGKFLSVPDLGNVTFNGTVEGRSFKIGNISTRLNGNFTSLTYKDYTYSNLTFNGEIKHKNFTGDFKAADTNFNFTSNIIVDLNGEAPSFNVLGDLVNANLRAMKFTKDSVSITGLFDLNFRGHNIDDFLGYAKILNASVTHNNNTLDFDSLVVTAALDSLNHKELTLASNEFNVSVAGQYSILQLPQSFQAFLSRYYPSIINPPKSDISNQDFVVTLRTGDFDSYAQLIDSNLSDFNDILLTGKINTVNGNKFNWQLDVPAAKYKNFSLQDAKFTGDGTADSLLLTGNIGKIFISDSTYFPNTKIEVHSSNDLSHVFITTSANATLNKANLDAEVRTLHDGVSINFHPSSFVLNEKTWNLQNQGEVVIRNHFSSAKNMEFIQGFQKISIESVENNGTSNALAVRLKNLNMADVFPLFVKRPTMEGIANGDIYLRDIYTNFNADAKIQLTQYRLNNDSIGIVDVTARYDKAGKIIYNLKANNHDFVVDGNGFYDLKDSVGKPLETSFKLDHAKIGILNTFLGTLFDNITGLATGTINLHGSFKELHLTGQAHLDSGALTVRYTNVRYTIPSADFVFKEDEIDFGTFDIKDKFGNTGTVKGVLKENGFKNNRYNLSMSTNKLLVLDTKAKDNPLFYGDVIGKVNLSLTGPEENMRMSINGEPADISHFYIQTNANSKNSDADFIIFKQYGEQLQQENEGSNSNLNIDLGLTANNLVTVSVILDELTGDIIEATGNGKLSIHVPAVGDVSMSGRYNIERGNYNFNFQSLVKRPFELLPEQNSYIEWNGSPYNANINITARYTAKNVTLSDLTSGSASSILLDQNILGYRGDVYVIADLNGKLSHPDIKFKLDFPEGSAIRSNDNFNRLLAKMESDENEMLKQVTWLIVFNSFSPYGELAGGQSFVQSTGINTISQKVASVLNSYISDFLYKLTGDKTLHFDVGAKTYSSYNLSGSSSSNNTLDRTAVELKVNKSLLNNKVIVTFGGDLDFNISGAAATTSNNGFQWLPDISVQIILSRDRKLRAIIFNHSSIGYGGTAGAIGRVTRQGISISYSRDFDKLFGKNENNNLTDEVNQEPVAGKKLKRK